MPEPKLLDIYGCLEDIAVQVTQHPRRATIDFRIAGKSHCLQLDNPNPVSSIICVLDDCWNIVVIDRNAQNGGGLEFGRYQVEFWGEDNPISRFVVDRFEHYVAD